MLYNPSYGYIRTITTMKYKKLNWIGSSLDDLKSFPETVRKQAGYQLSRVQLGLEPTDWKPMASVGLNVREIRIQYRGQYRIIYVLAKKDAVYVLHSFIKKSQKARKEDIDIAKKRFKKI